MIVRMKVIAVVTPVAIQLVAFLMSDMFLLSGSCSVEVKVMLRLKLFVCILHGTSRLPLYGFSRNLIFEHIKKKSFEKIGSLIKI
jgi:hypothetical protein